MKKRMTVLIFALTLSACGSGDAPHPKVPDSTAETASAVPAQDPSAVRPCIRELFDKSFCLGGSIDRLSENRRIPKVSEIRQGDAVVHVFAQSDSFSKIEIRAVETPYGIMEITRQAVGPDKPLLDFYHRTFSAWHAELGEHEYSVENGEPVDRWEPNGYTVEIVRERGDELPSGFDSFLLRVKVR